MEVMKPLTVTITHILNNKSGINFGSYAHTGLPVGVFVQGVGRNSLKVITIIQKFMKKWQN